MANPTRVEVPQGAWTEVAGNVSFGALNRLSTNYDFYQTYRASGSAAPDPVVGRQIPSEAVPLFESGSQDIIRSIDPIDIYVLCFSKDGKVTAPGEIRVDL